MKRVTGIGGIFFMARDAAALREWYRRHLGVALEAWGGAVFPWRSDANPDGAGTTVWNVLESTSDYLQPGHAPFMINYRVDNLHALLDALRAEGCAVDAKVEESEYGKFGWVLDPEGNKVELWEPPAGR
jgi:catechol 2,3-dioxygenase-like lactoylglutathione lyase family enzyme